MFARKSIKRANNRVYHINRNFCEVADSKNSPVLPDDYGPEFSHVLEICDKRMEYIHYLDRLRCKAVSRRSALERLPWWRKIFLA